MIRTICVLPDEEPRTDIPVKEFSSCVSNPNALFWVDFFGEPDHKIQVSKYIELQSIQEIIKEIVPSVSVTRDADKVRFKITAKYRGGLEGNTPMVLLDGVPVYDYEQLLKIDPKELASISVVTTKYYVSDVTLEGIIQFTTKKGNFDFYEPDKSVFRMKYELADSHHKFNSPQYHIDSIKNNHIPDYRNTLYWNPDLHTDRNGSASAEFYSSDEACEYIVTVTGLTRDGRRGSSATMMTISH